MRERCTNIPPRDTERGKLPMRTNLSRSKLFWTKVHITNTCWLWTASVDRCGYGKFSIGRSKWVRAHRWLWERFNGPVPVGLELDHLCRTSACVKPSHLEPVTHIENMRRGRVWLINAEKTHCPAGHPYDEANTYHSLRRRSRICRSCQRSRMKRARCQGLAGKHLRRDHEGRPRWDRCGGHHGAYPGRRRRQGADR